MGRIYIPPIKVQNLFLQRWSDKDWTESDEHNDKEFLEIEKEIYLEHFPNMVEQFKSEKEVSRETSIKGGKAIEVDSESDGESDESSKAESSGESGLDSSSNNDGGSDSESEEEEGGS